MVMVSNDDRNNFIYLSFNKHTNFGLEPEGKSILEGQRLQYILVITLHMSVSLSLSKLVLSNVIRTGILFY